MRFGDMHKKISEFKDKNALIARSARKSPIRRLKPQTTIYIPDSIIHVHSAFTRVGRVKSKYHIL
uniref:Uncharacterized protein n=1 Tax=Siphoviridae sp. ctBCr48 TaxID=2827802 RepID=A0A8S5SHE8_9CAUD|nr:MAG TPA: hypothetical protein [Siphoviridae sp. ctBCr48]